MLQTIGQLKPRIFEYFKNHLVRHGLEVNEQNLLETLIGMFRVSEKTVERSLVYDIVQRVVVVNDRYFRYDIGEANSVQGINEVGYVFDFSTVIEVRSVERKAVTYEEIPEEPQISYDLLKQKLLKWMKADLDTQATEKMIERFILMEAATIDVKVNQIVLFVKSAFVSGLVDNPQAALEDENHPIYAAVKEAAEWYEATMWDRMELE